MLAGLWGAHNYMDMAMAKKVKAKTSAWYQTNLTTESNKKVKSALLDVQPNLFKFYDQRILQFKVFPLVGTSFYRCKKYLF